MAKSQAWLQEVLTKSQQDPNLWIKEILGDRLWSRQREICQSVVDHERTAVPASFGCGKTFLAARIALWFLYNHPGAKVISCYDDQTEILTELRGFQLFKNLLPDDKVATLVHGNLVFEKPQDHYDMEYKGELMGYEGRDVDFLVTPNHRCQVAVDPKLTSEELEENQSSLFEIKRADEIFGSLVRVPKTNGWLGEDYGYTKDDYRFWGFWCGDGSLGFKKGKPKVVRLHQKVESEEALRLIHRYEGALNVREDSRCEGLLDIRLWNVELATFLHDNFGHPKKVKRIPTWIKNSKLEFIEEFLRGFALADGVKSKDVHGKSILRFGIINNEALAEDFYEMGVRAGYSVNLKSSVYDHSKYKDYSNNVNTHYRLTFSKRTIFPSTKIRTPTARNRGWYKKEYNGRIHCVRVTSGVVLVRRNRKHLWSGNTAPCFDDQTEILTDEGWKLFKDLNKDEKVASRVDGKLQFVHPTDYMDYDVYGEMIGYKSNSVDFLVTPHHKCLVQSPGKDFELRKAEDIYGSSSVKFNKKIVYEGVERSSHFIEDCSINKDVLIEAKKENWYKTDYVGHVYCVTVPSHVVLVRRSGVYHWSGQTFRQVQDLLWSEIRTAHGRAAFPLGGNPLKLRLELSPDQFAVGFSTDDKNMDMFTGYHSPYQLVIFDQAAGIPPGIWDGAEGLMTSAHCRWLAISNTAISDCEFANICMPEKKSRHGEWNIIKISAEESPNVIAGKNLFPGLIAYDWVEKKKKVWDVDDPLYKIFVKAEFIPSMQMVVVPYKDLVEVYHYIGEEGETIELGIDVAREGLDSTVFFARTGERSLEMLRLTGNDTMQVAGAAVKFIEVIEEKYSKKVVQIKIDTIGVGAGVYDRMAELDYPVVPINNQSVEPVIDKETFSNIRAEMAWSFRRRCESGNVGFARLSRQPDLFENLKKDAQAQRYKITSSGRIQLLPKESMREFLGRSPDYWDAMIMAFENPGGGPAKITSMGTNTKPEEPSKTISNEEWMELLGREVDIEHESFH